MSTKWAHQQQRMAAEQHVHVGRGRKGEDYTRQGEGEGEGGGVGSLKGEGVNCCRANIFGGISKQQEAHQPR